MVLGDSKKKWLHSADVLIRSRVSYQVKFVGKVEVNQPKGIEVARSALQKLSFNKQIKRSEGTKPAKVQLSINVKGITISDNRTKEVLHNVPLHLISFCSDDKKDKHLFSFIAKVGEENKHYCFGFESGNEANNITLSIGQAFDVAYQEFLKKKKDGAASITGNSSSKQMRELHNKVNELALENTKLKERIAQLEGEKNKDAKKSEAASKCISGSLSSTVQTRTEGSEVTGTDPFDMQPFAATTFVTSSIPPALVKLAPPEHSSATTRSNRSPQSNHNNTTIGELLNSSISFENNPSVIPPSEHRSSEFTNRMAETHSCGSVLYSLRRLSSLLNDYIERDTSTTSGSSLHFTSNIQPCSVATTSSSVNNPMTDHW